MPIKKETSGYKGWAEVKFFEGKDKSGKMLGDEGFRNVVTGEACRPEKGWDGAPPRPTGDLACVRHVSEAYRRGWERIWGPGSGGQASTN